MTTRKILEKYIKYFEDKGHKQIPNVSLIPQEDATLLFVNSGMFPLVPYLTGGKHPLGSRLLNVQRCIRMVDFDEVGDRIHTLVFHMIGNWSLGDYFKEEQLNWAYDFFINILKLEPSKMYATVFAGDGDISRDDKAIEILKNIFSKHGVDAEIGKRIFLGDKKTNWWVRGESVGELGGPDSEIFYYLGEGDVQSKNPIDNEEDFVEIGNSVFMQYEKTEDGWIPIKQKNIDFGGGLERVAMVVQGKSDIFETDNFWPIILKIQQISGRDYYESEEVTKSMRIIADHMRASMFLSMDGVTPSNKDQGYILRRLLRRMIREGKNLGIEKDLCSDLIVEVVDIFEWLYPDLKEKEENIKETFEKEERKFIKTLNRGEKELEKIRKDIEIKVKDTVEIAEGINVSTPSVYAFDLYQSQGYPPEMFIEDLGVSEEKASEILDDVKKQISFHKEKSRAGSEQKFKGGLAGQDDVTIKYHTTTHLLQAALREVVEPHISQKGSNITTERLRFDYSYPGKLNDEQISKVEDYIEEKIKEEIPVFCEIIPKEEAINKDASFMENESYPDKVTVYVIGKDWDNSISKEFCGGPHISNTSELKPIKIYKQKNIGEGKNRIYAKFVV